MNFNPNKQTRKISGAQGFVAIALVLGCAFRTVANAAAQKVTFPVTPSTITPRRATPVSRGTRLRQSRPGPERDRELTANNPTFYQINKTRKDDKQRNNHE